MNKTEDITILPIPLRTQIPVGEAYINYVGVYGHNLIRCSDIFDGLTITFKEYKWKKVTKYCNFKNWHDTWQALSHCNLIIIGPILESLTLQPRRIRIFYYCLKFDQIKNTKVLILKEYK